MTPVEKSIKEFKERIDLDGLEFCKELYRHATVRPLAAKYAYYVLDRPYLKDVSYDGSEQGWYIMGRALGVLNEDETSPCVGFNEKHPLAKEAVELSLRLSKGPVSV